MRKLIVHFTGKTHSNNFRVKMDWPKEKKLEHIVKLACKVAAERSHQPVRLRHWIEC